MGTVILNEVKVVPSTMVEPIEESARDRALLRGLNRPCRLHVNRDCLPAEAHWYELVTYVM